MGKSYSRELYVNQTFLAAAVIFLALSVRILHVIFTAKLNPLAFDLAVDAAGYDRWAKALVWGGEPGHTTLMQAPLFPWFLAVIYRVFGPSLTAVRLVHALLGTFTCGFIIAITRRLFRSSAAGIVAGAAMALYLPAIFYEGVLVPATLILFLDSSFLMLMVPEKRPVGNRSVFLAGAVLGLSILAKPIAIILFPFAVLHLFFNLGMKRVPAGPIAGNGRGRSWMPQFASKSALLAAGMIVAILPLTIRNAKITGEFLPLTTGGGINFYIGNNPRANGYYAVPEYRGRSLGGTPERQKTMMYRLARAESGRKLSHSEVSGFWLNKGIEFCRREPGRCATLVWNKFIFFWNRHERANVESLYFHRRFGGILSLPLVGFGLLAPFGLLGLLTSSSRWKSLILLYGGVAAYLGAALVFYVLARYRLPVVPFLAPFAGIGVIDLLKSIRNRERAAAGLRIAVLFLLFYFVNMRVSSETTEGTAANLVRLGRVYEGQGQLEKARTAYRESLELDRKNKAARAGLKSVSTKEKLQ